jgi:hypothetical protein
MARARRSHAWGSAGRRHLYALDQQRMHILLSARPRLARAVLADLPGA